MKHLLLTILVSITSLIAIGQTWSDDVAQIVYDKCTKCHHSGGVAPFSLMTYSEASAMAPSMYDPIFQEKMPPWPPDSDYQGYVHDRSLSPSEKITMLDWLLNGYPEGNAANTPPPPVYQSGSILGNGDLQLQIPTYMSKATASDDDYVCFSLPTGLLTDRVIKAVEVVPGNSSIVHHALIYIDPDGSSPTDTVGSDCGGPSNPNAKLITGYTPGASPLILPDQPSLKLGMTITANSSIYFAMHYPAGSYGEYDSTKVIFHFYPPGESGIRQISADPILQNWSFAVPPDQHTSVSADYGPIPVDISVLSVFPHMHLLGENMRVYGIKPNTDTIRMMWLPHWDFHWQDFYFFDYIKKADAGSNFYADGMFDNTSGNIHNPNNPPIAVFPGLNTSDEMFLVYFHYMLYQNGDENFNMDSLINLSTLGFMEQNKEESAFSVYPNPFEEGLTIYSNSVKAGDVVSVLVYNYQGQLVSELMKGAVLEDDELKVEWDGKNSDGNATASGVYMISTNVNGAFRSQKVIKR